MSRPSKRQVRTLYLDLDGKRKKYFLKQSRSQSLKGALKRWCGFQQTHSATAREILLLQLFREHGIPVMNPVAWGERKIFGWSMGGFLLVEEVVGKEFVEVYRTASSSTRRRLMWVHGELMGNLHEQGIESKVHPRDLICVSRDYTTFRTCLVVIDRERGHTRPMNLAQKYRGKSLADIWVKGAFTIGRGSSNELLAFLSGYCVGSGIRREDKSTRSEILRYTVDRVTGLLDRDQRYSNLRKDFKERYGIPDG